MKRSMSVILGALALMITVGCIWQYRKGNRDASCTKQLFAMDTVMSFTAYGPKAEEAVDAAMKEIERLDALLSTGNRCCLSRVCVNLLTFSDTCCVLLHLRRSVTYC